MADAEKNNSITARAKPTLTAVVFTHDTTTTASDNNVNLNLKHLLQKYKFITIFTSTLSSTIEAIDSYYPALVLIAPTTTTTAPQNTNGEKKKENDIKTTIIQHTTQNYPQTFKIIYDIYIASCPHQRQHYFQPNTSVSMVTADVAMIEKCIKSIRLFLKDEHTRKEEGIVSCPWCGMNTLTSKELWLHAPMYHINSHNIQGSCPVCICDDNNDHVHSNLMVHIHNRHQPHFKTNTIQAGGVESSSSSNHHHHHHQHHHAEQHGTPLYAFALLVVQNPLTKKYLLVQEFANSGYWLPGGRVDDGENFQQAAMRECIEEAGIEVKLTGVLQVQFHPCHHHRRHVAVEGERYVRLRVIFMAEPVDCHQQPKSLPDFESVGAVYASAEEILGRKGGEKGDEKKGEEGRDNELHWRGGECKRWVKYVEDGGIVSDMCALSDIER